MRHFITTKNTENHEEAQRIVRAALRLELEGSGTAVLFQSRGLRGLEEVGRPALGSLEERVGRPMKSGQYLFQSGAMGEQHPRKDYYPNRHRGFLRKEAQLSSLEFSLCLFVRSPRSLWL